MDVLGAMPSAPRWVRPLQGFLLGFLPAVGWLVLELVHGASLVQVLRADWSVLVYLVLAGTSLLTAFGAAMGRGEQKWCEKAERLSNLALTDPMTGLRNRRYFQARFDESYRLSRRARAPLSLAIIDVDRFKDVNDRHGHQVGDQVLRAVAVALRSVVRRGETLARVGGEEFALILPGLDQAGAERVAERVRTAIENTRVMVPGVEAPLSVTASVGVAEASYRPSGGGPSELYRAADEALRAAKAHGRNRVEVTGPLPLVRVCA